MEFVNTAHWATSALANRLVLATSWGRRSLADMRRALSELPSTEPSPEKVSKSLAFILVTGSSGAGMEDPLIAGSAWKSSFAFLETIIVSIYRESPPSARRPHRGARVGRWVRKVQIEATGESPVLALRVALRSVTAGLTVIAMGDGCKRIDRAILAVFARPDLVFLDLKETDTASLVLAGRTSILHQVLADGHFSSLTGTPIRALPGLRALTSGAIQLHTPYVSRSRPRRIAGMATMKSRITLLPDTIGRLVSQVDSLHVYLNGFEDIPASVLQSGAVFHGLQGPDLKDNGKFAALPETNDAIILTVDDDIAYPPYYVDWLSDRVAVYSGKAVVGLHAEILKPDFHRYLTDRKTLCFWNELREDRLVHLLGTGTIAMHSQVFNRIGRHFPSAGMADIWFAIAARAAKVPLVAIARRHGELTKLQPNGSDSLYAAMRADDSAHSEALRNAAPWPILPEPRLGHILATPDAR